MVTSIPWLFNFWKMGKMLLFKNAFFCMFQRSKYPLKPKNSLENIQFECLCTLSSWIHSLGISRRFKRILNIQNDINKHWKIYVLTLFLWKFNNQSSENVKMSRSGLNNVREGFKKKIGLRFPFFISRRAKRGGN